MKTVSKSDRRSSLLRRWSCRLSLELLEGRSLPSTGPLTGLGLNLLGASLDLGTLPTDDSVSDSPAPAHLRDLDTSLPQIPAVPLAAVSSPAPVQVTHPAGANPSLPLRSADQAAALHVVPVAGLGASGKATAATPTPVARASSGVAQGAAVTPVPVQLQDGPPIQVTTETIRAIGPQWTQNWASYFGGPGANNALLSVVYTNASNGLIVGGYTQDPTDATKVDATVAQISRNGTTATIARYTGFPSGSRAEVHSVAAGLDPSGNLTAIYVGGFFNIGGVNKAFVASLGPNLGNLTVNWTRIPPSTVTVPSSINGIKLVGSDLYITGQVGNSLVVGDLTAATGATHNYLMAYAFGSQAVGNAVGVDSRGNADVAFQVVDSMGIAYPAWVQVAPDGSTPIGYYYLTGTQHADSTLNAVTVDSAGNAYYTGLIDYTGNTASFIPMVKVAPDGMSLAYLDQNGNPGVYWYWFLTNGSNWYATGNQVDAAGDQVTSTNYNDGSGTIGSAGILLFTVGPTGGTNVDFGNANLFGANDDYAYGIAQDTFNSNTFYVVGNTDSSDFNTTATFQPNFNGTAPPAGSDFNGWVGSANTP